MAQVISGEGNRTSYWDHAFSTGRFTSTITAPDDSETLYERSFDDLTVYKSLPCGMSLAFSYDVDPVYRFKFIKEMTETTPSALTKTTLRDKTYQDTDSNEVPDLITESRERKQQDHGFGKQTSFSPGKPSDPLKGGW